MWRCKNCGVEIVYAKTTVHRIDKNKNIKEELDKEVNYYCPCCDSESGNLEDIAEWVEE